MNISNVPPRRQVSFADPIQTNIGPSPAASPAPSSTASVQSDTHGRTAGPMSRPWPARWATAISAAIFTAWAWICSFFVAQSVNNAKDPISPLPLPNDGPMPQALAPLGEPVASAPSPAQRPASPMILSRPSSPTPSTSLEAGWPEVAANSTLMSPLAGPVAELLGLAESPAAQAPSKNEVQAPRPTLRARSHSLPGTRAAAPAGPAASRPTLQHSRSTQPGELSAGWTNLPSDSTAASSSNGTDASSARPAASPRNASGWLRGMTFGKAVPAAKPALLRLAQHDAVAQSLRMELLKTHELAPELHTPSSWAKQISPKPFWQAGLGVDARRHSISYHRDAGPLGIAEQFVKDVARQTVHVRPSLTHFGDAQVLLGATHPGGPSGQAQAEHLLMLCDNHLEWRLHVTQILNQTLPNALGLVLHNHQALTMGDAAIAMMGQSQERHFTVQKRSQDLLRIEHNATWRSEPDAKRPFFIGDKGQVVEFDGLVRQTVTVDVLRPKEFSAPPHLGIITVTMAGSATSMTQDVAL